MKGSNNKMDNRIKYIARWAAVLLLFALNLIAIGFLVWASDKGFDITDDGLYMLVSQFPGEIISWPNVFYLYTAKLYTITGQSVTVMRIFGIVFMTGSAIILFYGLYRLLRQIGFKSLADPDIIVAAWSLINFGVLLYYVFLLLTPSYNLINSAFYQPLSDNGWWAGIRSRFLLREQLGL